MQDGERRYARLYGGHPEVGMMITPGSWFRWKNGKLIVDETADKSTAEDERLALCHALGVLGRLASGKAALLWSYRTRYAMFRQW